MMSRATRIVLVASLLLALAAVAALAGETIKALIASRFDLTDGAGRVRASLQCDSQGRPELVTYAEDGMQDGRALLSTLVSALPKTTPTSAQPQSPAVVSPWEQIKEVDKRLVAAEDGSAEALDLLCQLAVLWRDLKVEPGDVAGEVARRKQLESVGMEFIRQGLKYRSRTGHAYVPDSKYNMK